MDGWNSNSTSNSNCNSKLMTGESSHATLTFQVHARHQTLAEAAGRAVLPPYLVYNTVVSPGAQVIMLP